MPRPADARGTMEFRLFTLSHPPLGRERRTFLMLLIAFALLVVLVLAGLVTAFVAFPHRGHDIPHAPWLSDAMLRTRDKFRP